MTYDKLVATDLAALGADSRQHPRAVELSLRRLGLDPDHRSIAQLRTPASELVLVAMASVFASRVARAAAGAMAVVGAAVLLIFMANPTGCDPDGALHKHCLVSSAVIDRSWTSFALLVGVLVVATYLLASRLAERHFERRLRGAGDEAPLVELGGKLVRTADGWSIMLAIAGVTSAVTLFGVVWFTIDHHSMIVFWGHTLVGPTGDPQGWIDDLLVDRIRDLAIAIPVVVIAAFALGRACVRHRPRAPARWLRVVASSTIPLGLFVGFTTVCSGIENEVDSLGFLYLEGSAGHPAATLRTVLTITGTLAVFLIMAGFTLWRRRREHARCGLTS